MKNLRRHYTINLAEEGAPMHDIQQGLGHASRNTTEKYYAYCGPGHAAKKILEGGKSRNGYKTDTSVRITGVHKLLTKS